MKKYLFMLVAAVAMVATSLTFTSCDKEETTTYIGHISLATKLVDNNNEISATDASLISATLINYNTTIYGSSDDEINTKVNDLATELQNKVKANFSKYASTDAYILVTKTGSNTVKRALKFDGLFYQVTE